MLYTVKQIKTLAGSGGKLTKHTTASQALSSITKKNKKVNLNDKFYHRGNGVFSKYSLSEDKKKTGSLTKDKNQWLVQPYRYDMDGIDTAVKMQSTKAHKTTPKKDPYVEKLERIGRLEAKIGGYKWYAVLIEDTLGLDTVEYQVADFYENGYIVNVKINNRYNGTTFKVPKNNIADFIAKQKKVVAERKKAIVDKIKEEKTKPKEVVIKLKTGLAIKYVIHILNNMTTVEVYAKEPASKKYEYRGRKDMKTSEIDAFIATKKQQAEKQNREYIKK
jgi:hypothetical protein